MNQSVTSYQARRHPFLFGLAVLVFGPYILAFAATLAVLFAVAYVIAVSIEAVHR